MKRLLGIEASLLLITAAVLTCSPGAKGAPPYDLSFIDAMTAHHRAAVVMAGMAESLALHPELKDFARMSSPTSRARSTRWRHGAHGGSAAGPRFPES